MNSRPPDPRVEEHLIPFGAYQTWSCVIEPPPGARAERPPVVILHGGPGIAHDYCAPMMRLAADDRRVIFYDQIGCGRSTHRPDAPVDFWSVDLFVAELKTLVDYYGLAAGGFHLLGQSWGGMLAPEYVLAHPEGVLSMTLADSPASMEEWVNGTRSLLAELPESVQRVVHEHEAAGTTDSAAYVEAVETFYHHYLCRIDPFPAELEASFEALEADPTVYQTMIGPSEFNVTGSLRHWSVVERLHAIEQPTLVVAGEFDEARPAAWQPFVERIANSEQHLFKGASHTPHLEFPEDFTQVVGHFLRRHDAPHR